MAGRVSLPSRPPLADVFLSTAFDGRALTAAAVARGLARTKYRAEDQHLRVYLHDASRDTRGGEWCAAVAGAGAVVVVLDDDAFVRRPAAAAVLRHAVATGSDVIVVQEAGREGGLAGAAARLRARPAATLADAAAAAAAADALDAAASALPATADDGPDPPFTVADLDNDVPARIEFTAALMDRIRAGPPPPQPPRSALAGAGACTGTAASPVAVATAVLALTLAADVGYAEEVAPAALRLCRTAASAAELASATAAAPHGLRRPGAGAGRPGGRSRLHAAAAAGGGAVTAILRALPRPSVDVRDARGRTALMYAAGAGDGDGVGALLAAGADPTARDASGASALLYGAAHAAVVSALLAAGADVTTRLLPGGATPLMAAAAAGSAPGVAALLAAPAVDVNAEGAGLGGECVFGDTFGTAPSGFLVPGTAFHGTAMTYAAVRGHAGVVAALARAPGVALPAALVAAARVGDVGTIAYLVDERGAAVNEHGPPDFARCGPAGYFGWTPLMEAAERGFAAAVAALLDRGADPAVGEGGGYDTYDVIGSPAEYMYTVAPGGRADVLRALAACPRADPAALVFLAATAGAADVVRAVAAAAGAAAPPLVNRKWRSGETPLFRAAAFGHDEVAQALLAAGAAVDCDGPPPRVEPRMWGARVSGAHPRSETATPLSRAVAGGHLRVVETLLAAGADARHPSVQRAAETVGAGGDGAVPDAAVDAVRAAIAQAAGTRRVRRE
jgi:ankyrin repeat protein